jgi:cytoskeleton protein RodZ
VAARSIGEELRLERIRQGLTLDDIVQRTRISARSLEAIEAEAFDRLAGVIFVRNFVRLYATDLKLDADALLSRLPRVNIDASPLPIPPAGSGRAKWDPRAIAALVAAGWFVALAGSGTAAWYYFSHVTHRSLKTVASAPAPSKRELPKASPAPPPAGPEAVKADDGRERSAENAGTTLQPASLQPIPTAGTSGDDHGAGYDRTRPVQVILTAREAAWVQVSADGHTAFVGTMHEHETRTIAADAQVKILTGNAGGLDISLNGKPLDPIGPSGQVRTVRLTAEGPQFVPRNPPSSSPL